MTCQALFKVVANNSGNFQRMQFLMKCVAGTIFKLGKLRGLVIFRIKYQHITNIIERKHSDALHLMEHRVVAVLLNMMRRKSSVHDQQFTTFGQFHLREKKSSTN